MRGDIANLLMKKKKHICDMECCDGSSEAPACDVSLSNESDVEFKGRCGEAPVRCVFVVLTVRQIVRGPDLLVLLCQVVYGVATYLRAHGSGLFGVVRPVSLGSLSKWSHT